jgi:hypothetical protein
VGGYRRDIANRVLVEGYGVRIHCVDADSDAEAWAYVRALPDGRTATSFMSFDVGLAAYPPDTLRRICAELELADAFDAIRRRIVERGGWVGPRP